jgi:hypothetical protein
MQVERRQAGRAAAERSSRLCSLLAEAVATASHVVQVRRPLRPFWRPS